MEYEYANKKKVNTLPIYNLGGGKKKKKKRMERER